MGSGKLLEMELYIYIYYNNDKKRVRQESRAWARFSMKGQVVNTFGFAVQLFCGIAAVVAKAATDSS